MDALSRFGREQGQSLLEVLAVMGISATLAGCVLALYLPVSAWVGLSWQETRAGNHAFAIMECLRNRRDLLDELNHGYSAEELGLGYPAADSGWESVDIGMHALADCPNLYEVTVTVRWEQGAASRSASLHTLMRRDWR